MLKKFIIFSCLCFGLWHVSVAGYMLAKAYLSQHLIQQAWQETIKDGQNHKPWSWADTFPVARLSIPRLDESTLILQGSSARNLAFSATHLANSGMPNQNKTMVISGHRDSHFNYLKNLKKGDLIKIESSRQTYNYVVSSLEVVDSKTNKLNIRNTNNLILTTCYPFDVMTSGGNLRYVVNAELKHM